MLGAMIGGAMAGLGAYAGGQAASKGAYASGRAIAKEIGSASDNVAASNFARAKAEERIAKNIGELNDTFDDQFNSREKRLITINLVDEDEEPIKFSTFFNQPPIFKENLNRSFRKNSGAERFHSESWEERRRREHNTFRLIEKEPNIHKALELLRHCVECQVGRDVFDPTSSIFMPHEIYEDIFMEEPLNEHDDLYSECRTKEENVQYNGANIIYIEFLKGGIERIKDIYRDRIRDARNSNSSKIQFGRFGLYTNINEVICQLDNWNPNENQREIYKQIDDLVNQNRQELKERLMNDQERSVIQTVRNFVKPGVKFECNEVDYNGRFAAFTVSNENGDEAYLMVREAPNVNVATKDGF